MREHTTDGTKKEFHVSLTLRIVILALIPLLVLSIVLTVAGKRSIREGMQDEILDKLESVVIAMEGAADSLDSGDYTLDEQNNLWKGQYNLTQHEEVLDKLVEGSDTDITFFYGKTRRATTLLDAESGERILGTDASDAVYDQVVGQGKMLEATDLTINGEHYYACYAPMKNADGTIVGMYFAGAPVSEFNTYIAKKVGVFSGLAAGISLVGLIAIFIMVLPIRNGVVVTYQAIHKLAEGDLVYSSDASVLRRKDELGDMARETKSLREELVRILSKIQECSNILLSAGNELNELASQTSSTADEISSAVEDISRGAVSQADEIESVSGNIMEMGEVIAKIVNGVAVLDTTSGAMEVSRSSAMNIVDDLSESNQKTKEAIAKIGEQVKTTNESANKISEAIQIIASIAEETNLLSLNASIEAARAGEQGRGFAVVANQIQKLAEQSNESSQKIAEIIAQLLADSNKTVDVMKEVEQIIHEESDKLTQTQSEFGNVSKGIEQSRAETNGIKGQTVVCDDSRKSVVDAVSNLSAISEENAASTQQTTASMQELNATINLLAESAHNLTKLSNDLNQEIQFFRL